MDTIEIIRSNQSSHRALSPMILTTLALLGGSPDEAASQRSAYNYLDPIVVLEEQRLRAIANPQPDANKITNPMYIHMETNIPGSYTIRCASPHTNPRAVRLLPPSISLLSSRSYIDQGRSRLPVPIKTSRILPIRCGGNGLQLASEYRLLLANAAWSKDKYPMTDPPDKITYKWADTAIKGLRQWPIMSRRLLRPSVSVQWGKCRRSRHSRQMAFFQDAISIVFRINGDPQAGIERASLVSEPVYSTINVLPCPIKR